MVNSTNCFATGPGSYSHTYEWQQLTTAYNSDSREFDSFFSFGGGGGKTGSYYVDQAGLELLPASIS